MGTPEFVLQLREKIGHDLLWMPGVTAVVLRGTDVLLVRRADNGLWTPVTGIIDPGEQPAQAAVREVLEETTVVATVDRLVNLRSMRPTQHQNGDHAQYLNLTFRCSYVSGTAQVGDDESSEVAWFPCDALPPSMPQTHRRRITESLPATGEVIFER